MRRALAILVVAGACAAAVLATGASEGDGSKGKSYWIEFDNSFGLVEGGDLKVGNVRAGQTTDFKVDAPKGERPRRSSRSRSPSRASTRSAPTPSAASARSR